MRFFVGKSLEIADLWQIVKQSLLSVAIARVGCAIDVLLHHALRYAKCWIESYFKFDLPLNVESNQILILRLIFGYAQ